MFCKAKEFTRSPDKKRRGQEGAENAPRTESAEDREKNRSLMSGRGSGLFSGVLSNTVCLYNRHTSLHISLHSLPAKSYIHMSRAVMIMGGVGISFANTYLDYNNTILIFKQKVSYEKDNYDGM